MPSRSCLVLIGFMGAGKTQVGKSLARRTGLSFVDLDLLIERKCRRKISEIFHDRGEGYFRDLETRTIRGLRDKKGLVLSTGGGAWIRPENRRVLRGMGPCIWLDARMATLWKRVSSRLPQRPLLGTARDPKRELERLYLRRKRIYRMADVRVHTDGRKPSEVAAIIIRRVGRPPFSGRTGRGRFPAGPKSPKGNPR